MAAVTGVIDGKSIGENGPQSPKNSPGDHIKTSSIVVEEGECNSDSILVESMETKDNGTEKEKSVTENGNGCPDDQSSVNENSHGLKESRSVGDGTSVTKILDGIDAIDNLNDNKVEPANKPVDTNSSSDLGSDLKDVDGNPADQPAIPSDHEDEDVESDDNFASIVSFFLCFGPTLGITYSMSDLKYMIEDKNRVHPELIELHVKLLRKRRKYINRDKWEKSLIKFIHEYNPYDAWEMERFGYKLVKSSIKVQLLKRLLEAQFDYNLKFKSEINAVEADSLRLKPLGRDVKGYQYWFQRDDEVNLRIYKEVMDEDTSWELVSNDKDGIESLLEQLKTNSAIEPIKESTNVSESEGEDSIEENHGQQDTAAQEEVKIKIEESVKSDLKPNQVVVVKSEEALGIKSEETTSRGHDDHGIIGEICNSIIDRVVESIDTSISASIENEETTNSVTPKSTPKKSGRGRGRGRSRGRGRPPGSGSVSRSSESKDKPSEDKQELAAADQPETPAKEVSKKPVVTTGTRNRGFGLSRELMELKSLAEQDLIDLERKSNGIADGQPIVRQSRRIQVLQEKKSQELAEKMKREAERREAEAKKRKAKQEELDKKRQEFQMEMDASNGLDSNSRSRKFKSDSEYEDNPSNEDKSTDGEDGKRGKKKRRRRKGKKGSKYPWFDESDDSDHRHAATSEEEIEEDDEELKFDDNDDEFACEDIEPDSEPVILKRARTAKKARSDSEVGSEAGEATDFDDALCKRCSKGDHPEWILLCDKCDSGFHTACCIPPLMIIPDGDWFCPPCENTMLIERLEEELTETVELLDKLDREKLSKARIKFVTVNQDNIIKENDGGENVDGQETGKSKSRKGVGQKRQRTKSSASRGSLSDQDEMSSGSGKSGSESDDGSSNLSDDSDGFNLRARARKKPINYQFKEYDDLINSAIRADDEYVEDQEEIEADPIEEDEEDPDRNYGKGKDIATIELAAREAEAKERRLSEGGLDGNSQVIDAAPVAVDRSEAAVDADDAKSMEDDEEPSGKKRKKQSKKRRLNDLDSPDEDDDSDESFKGSGSGTEIEEDFVASNDDTEENNSNESDDSDFKEYRRKSRRSVGKKSGHRSGSSRKRTGSKRYKRDDFVVDSDEDELESYGRKGRKTRTRNQGSRRKTYKESTSTEEETEEEEWIADDSPKPAKKGKNDDASDEEWATRKKAKKNGRSSDESFKEEDSDDDDNETEEDEDDKVEGQEPIKVLPAGADAAHEPSPIDLPPGAEDVGQVTASNEIIPSGIEVESPKKKSPKRKSPAKVTVKRRSRSKDGGESSDGKKKRKKQSKEKSDEESDLKVSKKKPSEKGKLEMRGKPRLSKARLMCLKEDSNDTNEDIEQEPGSVPPDADASNQDTADNVIVPSEPPPPLVTAPVQRPSIESPLIAAALTSGPNVVAAGPQSALSALTAFASRGPETSAVQTASSHYNPGLPPPGYNPAFGPPPPHGRFAPPPLTHSAGGPPSPRHMSHPSQPPPNPVDDPYHVSKPPKPLPSPDQYPPSSSSPTKMIHNLDARYPGQMPPRTFGSGPPPHPSFRHSAPPGLSGHPGYPDPSRFPGPPGYDPRMRTPPGPFDPRDSYPRDHPGAGYPGSAHIPFPAQGYPTGPRSYPGYPPLAPGHGYPGPPAQMNRPPSSNHGGQSQMPQSKSPGDPTHYKGAPQPHPPTSAPGHEPPGYQSGPPGYPTVPPPGYHHYPYPPHPGYGHDPYRQPPHSRLPSAMHHQGPPLPPYGSPYGPPQPPGYPGHPFYGQQPGPPSNGGFMISNLLHGNPGEDGQHGVQGRMENKSVPSSEPTPPARGRGRGRGSRGPRGSRSGGSARPPATPPLPSSYPA